MKASLATPPKKSAADILKMFDSPQGQVSGQQPAFCTHYNSIAVAPGC